MSGSAYALQGVATASVSGIGNHITAAATGVLGTGGYGAAAAAAGIFGTDKNTAESFLHYSFPSQGDTLTYVEALRHSDLTEWRSLQEVVGRAGGDTCSGAVSTSVLTALYLLGLFNLCQASPISCCVPPTVSHKRDKRYVNLNLPPVLNNMTKNLSILSFEQLPDMTYVTDPGGGRVPLHVSIVQQVRKLWDSNPRLTSSKTCTTATEAVRSSFISLSGVASGIILAYSWSQLIQCYPEYRPPPLPIVPAPKIWFFPKPTMIAEGIKYRVPSIPHDIPVQGKDDPPDGCGRYEVPIGDDECAELLSTEHCPYNHWILLNSKTKLGECVPRLCEEDRVYVESDQMCHDINEVGICPNNKRLYLNAAGHAVCDCPDGMFPGPNGQCHFLYEPSYCPKGSVLQFERRTKTLTCKADPCGSVNTKLWPDDLPFAPLDDGYCYQFNEQGPCKHGQRFGFDTDLLKAACVSLEEAGLLRPKSYVYEYMFLPANSDEQYKHYQLSYMIVNGTTWGLEVKGIEESNRGKREASEQSRISLDKEEIPILDTRDFSQKDIRTHNIKPTETSSEQYHRRSKYRQRYANRSSTGVRYNSNWSRKQLSRTNNNEPQNNNRFSNRRLSMIKSSGINTFRHYDSLRKIQDNSTSSSYISAASQQNQDWSRTPESTRKNHESFSEIQQFRRHHSKNIHRLRQPRNYHINIDAENDQMKIKNIQERFNSKHNISIPKFNNSQNFPMKGNKTEEKTKEKHKIRHEKHKNAKVEDIYSLVDTSLYKSENTTPIVKERKEKLFNHTSNGNSELVFNSTFGRPKDATRFNKRYHGSIKSSEKEKKQSEKIKVPNNNRSKINQQKIVKKRRRKGNRKNKHPVKGIEDLAGSTKFDNQIIKVNQNVKHPIEVKQSTESSSLDKKKRKRYRKRRKNKENNSNPLRRRERKSKQKRRRKKIQNNTKNGTVVIKRRKRKKKQSRISKSDSKITSIANDMLNNTTHSKNRTEESKQKVVKNSSESKDLHSRNKKRANNKRKQMQSNNFNPKRKNEKSKQSSTGLDHAKSESKEDSESSETSLPKYLSNRGEPKRRQTLSTGGGVIMTPLLSACKPGAKRDYNYKCRPKFIPQERKSQNRGDQPSESNVDPIPPRIKCPKGTRLDPRGKCQETSSFLG